jgi:thioredoxin-like negative regulator of GroEL
MSQYIVAITDAEFKKKVLEADRCVVVLFEEPESTTCKTVAVRIEEVAGNAGNVFLFFRVNWRENRVAANMLGVEVAPTVVFFENGRVRTWVEGIDEAEVLFQRILEEVYGLKQN